MKNKFKIISVCCSFIFLAILFAGCSSVFTAGISGKIVDAESSLNPKAGIQDVEVYVYTSEKARDADYNNWNKTSRFTPTTSKDFITHTTTNSNGEFSISKIVWEAFFPEFGKTADFCEVYLLFYHENYGLVKNSQIATIVSDATVNSVYQEMKKTKLQTVINLSIQNVATRQNVSESVIAKVTVGGKTYKQTISGNGNITVSYPRNADENAVASISVEQNGNDVRFYQCFNGGTPHKYEFMYYAAQTDEAAVTNAKKATISGDSCPITVYMKAKKVAVPSIRGTVSATAGKPNCDTVSLSFTGYGQTVDCGSVPVVANGVGNTMYYEYSGLGDGFYWEVDDSDADAVSSVTADVGTKSGVPLKSNMTSTSVNF